MIQYLSMIDQVYVINLEKRTDRKKKWADLILHLPSLSSKLQIFKAVDGAKLNNDTQIRSGELGCSLSHLSVWQDALEKGHRFILIFEDDVFFDADFEQRLEETLAEAKQDFDWLFLYNTWDYRPTEPYSETLEKVIASLGMQAYVLNTASIDRLKPYVEEFRFPIDVVMGHMSYLSKAYRPKKMLVRHDENSPSNISEPTKPAGLITRAKRLTKRLSF